MPKEESMFVKIDRDIKRVNELNDAIMKMTKEELDSAFENYLKDIKASESYSTNNYGTNTCLFTNNKNSSNYSSSNASLSRNSNSVNGIIYGPTIF
jgi:hypothetical protein